MKKIAIVAAIAFCAMLTVSCKNQPKAEAPVEEAIEAVEEAVETAVDSVVAAVDSVAAEVAE